MAEALTDRLEALTHGSATQPVGTVEWCGAVCSAMEEAAQALRLLGEVEKALEEIGDGAGMCSECGQHCGGGLECNCRHASWIPLDPKVEARSALDKLRKGMG